ncbi:MAG: segregation and condensation protein A [Dehalococcoidia bacterium]
MTGPGQPLRGALGLLLPMPQIALPVFNGPLDLLLHLIERDDLDITAVSLVSVADQFLKAIKSPDGVVNANALAEFVAIGAKLIYLKSKALLPRPPQEPEAEEDVEEAGRELVEMLLEYKRYKQVSQVLGTRQDDGLHVYSRLAPLPPQEPGLGLEGVTLNVMRKLMLDVMKRLPPVPPPQAVIQRESTVTIQQRVRDYRERLSRMGRFSFLAAINECKTRVEVLISFLAILELLKSGDCDAVQDAAWGDIEVIAGENLARQPVLLN